MEKKHLTVEEMKALINKNLVITSYSLYDMGREISNRDGGRIKLKKTNAPLKPEQTPIFTLTDLLNHLPSKLGNATLYIEYDPLKINSWVAYYFSEVPTNKIVKEASAPTLIEAAYKLLMKIL